VKTAMLLSPTEFRVWAWYYGAIRSALLRLVDLSKYRPTMVKIAHSISLYRRRNDGFRWWDVGLLVRGIVFWILCLVSV